ncbi:glycosyltransferase family 4 protein [Verrucomicrobiota bacterium]
MRILVVTIATQSGAARLVLDTCALLAATGHEFRFVLINRKGAWGPEFEALGACLDWPSAQDAEGGGRVRLGKKVRSFWETRAWREFVDDWNPELVYLNSAAVCRALCAFADGEIPVVMQTTRLCTPFRDELAKVPDRYVAVSEAVKRHLVSDWQIEEGRISVCRGGIDPARIDRALKEATPGSRRERFDFIVGGCGKTTWIKGVDIWLHAAAEVRQLVAGRNIGFVWCGGPRPARGGKWDMEHLFREIRLLGLEDVVEFTDHLDNPFPVVSEFDVLAMPSREDSFPLATLEAMYLGKPVVYFRACGGNVEMAADDAGVPVERFSSVAMAREVADLLLNRRRRVRMGEKAREKVLGAFTTARLAAEVQGVIESVISGRGAREPREDGTPNR